MPKKCTSHTCNLIRYHEREVVLNLAKISERITDFCLKNVQGRPRQIKLLISTIIVRRAAGSSAIRSLDFGISEARTIVCRGSARRDRPPKGDIGGEDNRLSAGSARRDRPPLFFPENTLWGIFRCTFVFFKEKSNRS